MLEGSTHNSCTWNSQAHLIDQISNYKSYILVKETDDIFMTQMYDPMLGGDKSCEGLRGQETKLDEEYLFLLQDEQPWMTEKCELER